MVDGFVGIAAVRRPCAPERAAPMPLDASWATKSQAEDVKNPLIATPRAGEISANRRQPRVDAAPHPRHNGTWLSLGTAAGIPHMSERHDIPEQTRPCSLGYFFALMFLCPIAGAILFPAAFLVYGVVVESQLIPSLWPAALPKLSYGMQAFVFSLVMAGLGAAAGLIAITVRLPQAAFVLFVPFVAAVLGCSSAWSAWSDSIARYGPDSSDYIVYLPVLLASAAVLFLVALSAIASLRRLL